jgi:hypothetical protein
MAKIARKGHTIVKPRSKSIQTRVLDWSDPQTCPYLAERDVEANGSCSCASKYGWAEGDIWWVNLQVDQPFEYKYVVVQGGKAISWEQGLNRLCQPSSLKSKELPD